MGNQQQNCNLKFTGKTIKPEHYMKIINQYNNGESLMKLGLKYNYSIATIRYFLLNNDISIRNVKDSINKLFTKFERLDEENNTTIEGTGLGLAITKKLLEMMHGKIVVNSVYGEGSEFTVALDQRISNHIH